jgi:hypothetical protein
LGSKGLTLWQGLVQAAAAQRPGLFLISVMDSLANSPFMAPAHAQQRHCWIFVTRLVQREDARKLAALHTPGRQLQESLSSRYDGISVGQYFTSGAR